MSFNEKDARAFYKWLDHKPNEFTEIRVMPWPSTGTVIQRWVQNEDDFVKLCREWSGKRQIYAGINPRKQKSGFAEDVSRLVAVPFDIDADRPKDSAATAEELVAARQHMIELNTWMRTEGYKQPLITMSGNGFHIISKVDIPITDDLSEKLESFFHEVNTSLKFGMDSIFDLPRIVKVPGTMSVKGVSTEERSHRLSQILTLGDGKTDEKLTEHIRSLGPYMPSTKPHETIPGETSETAETKRVRTSGLKPCFKKFAEEGGKLSKIGSEDNLLRLALVTEAHSEGYSQEQIVELFGKAEDFNEKETRYRVNRQLKDITVQGMKPWTCIAIYKHNGCFGEICKHYKKEVDKRLTQKEENSVEVESKVFEGVTEEVEAEVKRILDANDPLIIIETHLDNLIAGERENKLTIFILLLSGKSKDSKLKQMILIKGEAGAGKTTLMIVADLFKTKEVGRFTEHALDYTELSGFEILKLKEIGVMDEEKQGVSTIKFLSADDKGYTVEFTVKDRETGEFTTKQKRIPPITVISSTTRVTLDSQYTRRNWIISPDESEEQTKRVEAWIANDDRETSEVLLGLRKQTSYDLSKQVLTELVKKVTPSNVIIPFPSTLLKILDSKSLRVRGDYKKILALTRLYAILRQKELPELPAINGGVLLLTPEVALEAVNIALGPLTLMTAELDSRTKKMIEILNDLKITKKDMPISPNIRVDIMVKGGWNDRTVRSYLNEIENRGYLSSDDEKPKTWFMVYDMIEIMRRLSRLSVKIENADDLMVEMRKEAHKWLEGISAKSSEEIQQKISKISEASFTNVSADSVLDEEQPSPSKSDENHRQKQEMPMETEEKRKLEEFAPKNNVSPERESVTTATSATNTYKKLNGAPTCNLCVHFHTEECPMEHPNLIQPSATYPQSCEKHQPKKAALDSSKAPKGIDLGIRDGLGTCEVCHMPGAKPYVRRGGVIYLHGGCEEKHEGEL